MWCVVVCCGVLCCVVLCCVVVWCVVLCCVVLCCVVVCCGVLCVACHVLLCTPLLPPLTCCMVLPLFCLAWLHTCSHSDVPARAPRLPADNGSVRRVDCRCPNRRPQREALRRAGACSPIATGSSRVHGTHTAQHTPTCNSHHQQANRRVDKQAP